MAKESIVVATRIPKRRATALDRALRRRKLKNRSAYVYLALEMLLEIDAPANGKRRDEPDASAY